MDQTPLSVVIITKNEEVNLPECLASVSWAKEIVIVDDNSTDRTLELAKAATEKVFTRTMDVEGKQRNFAYEQASEPWILSLDADERVSPQLREELREVAKQLETPVTGYAIPIRTFIGKRWIKAAGYYPATRLRLFRRGCFRYEEAEVHPRAFLQGHRAYLRGDILHYGYRNFSHFIDKLNHQTTLEATKWVEDKRRIGWPKVTFKMLDRFSRNYFRKQGIADGFLGFMMCVFHSMYQLLTYSKYVELKSTRHLQRNEASRVANASALGTSG